MAKRVKYEGEWYVQDGCGAWVPEREYWRGASWDARHPRWAAVIGAVVIIGFVVVLACL